MHCSLKRHGYYADMDKDGQGEAAAGTLVRARSLRERIRARRQEDVADSASVVEQLRRGRVYELL